MDSINPKHIDRKTLEYIEIVIELLCAEIRFPRAGPKPLICKQCFLIKGTFKRLLYQIYYNIWWKYKMGITRD